MSINRVAAAQLREAAAIAWDMRWTLGKDPNGDGYVTISDVWTILVWAFFAPGDWVLLMTMHYAPGLAHFLEISPASLYGGFSGVLSAAWWLLVFALVALVNSKVDPA